MADQFTKSIIVKADRDTAYRIWSNFENFPMFMENIKKVTNLGNSKSHWEMKGPMGATLEWDAYMTRNDPNKRIAWSTKDDGGGDVTTSGQVTFNGLPDNETEVTVTLQYVPKKGIAGEVMDRLFSNPEGRLEHDLSNFKAYVEGMHSRTSN